MAKDPVCGMTVQEKDADSKQLTSEYQGQKYFFCNAGCKQDFQKNPSQYSGGSSAQRKTG